ncbi:MAG TPA: hypothetical protein VNO30_19340 [Kofleriaceae bacterium]|nr:hypothetical protein [Kofleriaceae bacterium]
MLELSPRRRITRVRVTITATRNLTVSQTIHIITTIALRRISSSIALLSGNGVIKTITAYRYPTERTIAVICIWAGCVTFLAGSLIHVRISTSDESTATVATWRILKPFVTLFIGLYEQIAATFRDTIRVTPVSIQLIAIITRLPFLKIDDPVTTFI